MIAENRWKAGSLRIFYDRCELLWVARFPSSAILQSLTAVVLLSHQLYHGLYGSLWTVQERWRASINFQDRPLSLWIVHNRWNRTHIYFSDHLSRSQRIAGQSTCCFLMIFEDGYKTSAIISDSQRSYGNQKLYLLFFSKAGSSIRPETRILFCQHNIGGF